MADHATPNLPSRDFAATSSFYGALGFVEGWRDAGWMILRRGGLTLEFFPFPDLDLLQSSFGCCLRLDELDRFYSACKAAGLLAPGAMMAAQTSGKFSSRYFAKSSRMYHDPVCICSRAVLIVL